MTPNTEAPYSRIESSPLYNEDLAPATAQRTALGHIQLRRAVDFDVSEHSHLHAGRQLDSRGNELEAGGRNHLYRQRHRTRADAAKLASRREVRNSVPCSGSRFVRSVGRKLCGGSSRTRRLRMVRHSSLDRRRSYQHPPGNARSQLEKLSLWPRRLLFHFLADQSRSRPQGHRVHPHPAGHQRAGSAGRRSTSVGVGVSRCRRLRAYVLGAIALHQLFPTS